MLLVQVEHSERALPSDLYLKRIPGSFLLDPTGKQHIIVAMAILHANCTQRLLYIVLLWNVGGV